MCIRSPNCRERETCPRRENCIFRRREREDAASRRDAILSLLNGNMHYQVPTAVWVGSGAVCPRHVILNDCHLGTFFIPPFLRSNQSLQNGEKEFAAHRPRPHLLHCSSVMLHASGRTDEESRGGGGGGGGGTPLIIFVVLLLLLPSLAFAPSLPFSSIFSLVSQHSTRCIACAAAASAPPPPFVRTDPASSWPRASLSSAANRVPLYDHLNFRNPDLLRQRTDS